MRLWQGSVLPEWLDYNGHMTEHRYLQVFGESSDALYGRIGVDFADAGAGAYYTLETHIRHLKETRVGTALWTTTEILGYDEKRLHLLHRLFDSGDALLATGEHLAIHVADGRACAAPDAMLDRIALAYAPVADRPWPGRVGSVLAKPLRISRGPAPVAA